MKWDIFDLEILVVYCLVFFIDIGKYDKNVISSRCGGYY